jgi:phosphoribosylglycinamide formyltransferase 2
MHQKILLLGSGELGKELVIALQRLGQTVIAVDSYAGAPAMQVADGFEVINMLDAAQLDEVVQRHQPNLIVPEIEAIRTEQLYAYEQAGTTVVPSAKAANFTMNRKLIRDLASKTLGIKTADYFYANTYADFLTAVEAIGYPCVVKPLMSSSGKGQSVLRHQAQAEQVWSYAIEQSRGDIREVIVESFIPFESEITLLTVTQKTGNTLFCAPIGHRQERGDYQESWQPAHISSEQLAAAQQMAERVTNALGGAGIWGVEFFITADEVYFSELSPRPHDTGMVTLANTQNLSQFELHARTILGLPIPQIELQQAGASAVLLAHDTANNFHITGMADALQLPGTDLRIFGKPSIRPYRRMGVVLAYGELDNGVEPLRLLAQQAASMIQVHAEPEK